MAKGIKKKEIMQDPDIKTIAIEHIDKDEDQIKIISEVRESHTKTLVKTVGFIVAMGVGIVLILGAILLFLNANIVQGNIEGAILDVAGISIVDKDYRAEQYIKEGKTVYYGGQKDNFFNLAGSFKIGKIAKIVNNHIYLEGTIKQTSINYNEINYVLTQ